MYEIEFASSAKKELTKVPKIIRKAIFKKIETLSSTPRPPSAKKLQGKHHGLYRIRVRNYRVIYSILDGKLLILVLHVDHRKDIYC